MKKLVTVAFCAAASTVVLAQTYEEFVRQQQQQYSTFKKNKEAEFKAFRDEVNAQYAEMLSKMWDKSKSSPAIKQPQLPEPPKPVVADPLAPLTTKPLAVKKVILPVTAPKVVPVTPIIKVPKDEPLPEIVPSLPTTKPTVKLTPTTKPAVTPIPVVKPLPKPVVTPTPVVKPAPVVKPQPEVKPTPVVKPQPEVKPKPASTASFKFSYYGTECSVELDASHKFTLPSVDEKGVATAWKLLSDKKYNDAIVDCLQWKEKLKLSDWGYVTFIEKVTQDFCGASRPNEAKVMQMFILIQSGYKVRIARADKLLFVLVPMDTVVYEYSYLTLDGEKFYVLDNSDSKAKGRSYFVFNQKFPNEQKVTLGIAHEPLLAANMSQPRQLKSKKYSNVNVTLSVNKNLVDFYDEFPRSESWAVYSNSSLSSETKSKLYPVLKSAISGKSDLEAANILINFVQTAFAYKTDGDQFGKEKPLFADESLFYPYCDCEDRSILYSILVRELLSLDVVFLGYPNHLATAVNFKTNVAGDYVSVDGKRYVVSDPTYIGASVGMAMPQFKNSEVEVFKY